MIRQQQAEEEWFRRKMELQKLSGESDPENATSKKSQQTMKLLLVKDKPGEDIVGLPHSIEGYKEAKRILQETYGKDSKVHEPEVLVQKDDDWEEWDLKQLVENLRKYVDRHPLRVDEKEGKDDRNGNKPNWRNREKLLLGYGGESHRRSKCIYCNAPEHSAVKSTKVLSVGSSLSKVICWALLSFKEL